jgi:hypothetical protein
MRIFRILSLVPLVANFSHATILPENDALIPRNQENGGLTLEEYHRVIDQADVVFRPIVEGHGKRLTIRRPWEDPRVNAGASKRGREWIINLYGGYARHRHTTPDGFALVICHELGHHLGGTPKKLSPERNPRWASAEGQADYYATAKCLRKIFSRREFQVPIDPAQVPLTAREKCDKNFSEDLERKVCYRIGLAGLSVGRVSADIRRSPPPALETPDLTVIESTYKDHPLPQCRLDTYFQGAICPIPATVPFSETDETSGACHPAAGHQEGVRPSCWFRSSR